MQKNQTRNKKCGTVTAGASLPPAQGYMLNIYIPRKCRSGVEKHKHRDVLGLLSIDVSFKIFSKLAVITYLPVYIYTHLCMEGGFTYIYIYI